MSKDSEVIESIIEVAEYASENRYEKCVEGFERKVNRMNKEEKNKLANDLENHYNRQLLFDVRDKKKLQEAVECVWSSKIFPYQKYKNGPFFSKTVTKEDKLLFILSNQFLILKKYTFVDDQIKGKTISENKGKINFVDDQIKGKTISENKGKINKDIPKSFRDWFISDKDYGNVINTLRDEKYLESNTTEWKQYQRGDKKELVKIMLILKLKHYYKCSPSYKDFTRVVFNTFVVKISENSFKQVGKNYRLGLDKKLCAFFKDASSE